ncbi:matrixin family metalloprotease [Polyangium jinanense]|uniref:Matrixin family metalloprotease n=1 Tax=Polyangium jinanense TaxID=2829994 RepID=A0A9X3X8X0_9BACT|nr:matrixin family metalloprotease [Polyangium jinanense]MDC3955986.1 matrixin family metalloprotease [Polyangium jinanense]MDC3955992.1 matrixin family metalloprotease [Polyangium jinanense]MDC3961501.1 matrixin family metalloprotease [Polyangium jinanense]MDC3986352.1 matrixin family metalloprotease [Polyangium jinanense]
MMWARAVLVFVRVSLAMFVALSFTPEAWGYEHGRSEYGARLHLTSLPARVRLATPVPGLSDGGRGAMLRAMATWSRVVCGASGFSFVEANAGEDAPIEVRAVLSGWRHGPAIGAHTDVESDKFTGNIQRVVIELDATRRWSDAENVPADALDLETVLLHELGHAAGLAHSGQTSAVMRAGLKPGHAPRRALDPDDVAGICASYAAPSWVKKDERLVPTIPRALALFAAIGALGAGIAAWKRGRKARVLSRSDPESARADA